MNWQNIFGKRTSSRRSLTRGGFGRPTGHHRRVLRVEPLEPRHLLSAIVTVAPNPIGVGAGLADLIFDKLSEEGNEGILFRARQLLDMADSSVIYQAFPGEVNDVELSGAWGNLFLLLNEDSNISMIRGGFDPILPPLLAFPLPSTVLPPFTKDIIDIPTFDFGGGAKVGAAGGPVVVEGKAELGPDIKITGSQIKGVLKQFFDVSDARAIILNATSLLDLIPDLGNFVGALDAILDFDLRDMIPPIHIDPLISVDLPFGLPNIEIPPEMTIDIVSYVEDLGLPTSLRDVVGAIPAVGEFVDFIDGFINFFTQKFISDSVFISTLDGDDNINFENLTGIPVQVYAGGGTDTIRAGGGMGVIESWDDWTFGIASAFFARDPAKIELFGEGGQDTFEVIRHFNSRDFNIDGGSGNDRLVVLGSRFDDIIQVKSTADGMVKEINFIAPDPNGGLAMNEVQVVKLPPDTSGGTFTLMFENRDGTTATTVAIDYDADEDKVQDELEALTSIGAGNVNVAGPAQGPWVVQFTGDFEQQNQLELTADGSKLTQAGAEVSIVRKERGNADQGTNQVQKITLPPNDDSSDPSDPGYPNERPYISGGTFTLTFVEKSTGTPATTGTISYFASTADVQHALEALPTIDPGDVNVTGTRGGPWSVEFTGNLALEEQELIEADGKELTGGVAATVTDDPSEQPLSQQATPRVIEITRPDPLPGQVLGGTFTLEFGGDVTVPLTHDVSGAVMETALANLDPIDADEVTVDGPAGGPWTVRLTGSPAESGSIVADPSGLTGTVDIPPDVSIATATNEEQVIPSPAAAGATGGTFRMTFSDGIISRTTAEVPFDATVAEIQTALEDLGSINGPANVNVTGSTPGPWTATFTGTLSGQDLAEIELDSRGLTQSVGAATITSAPEGTPGVNEVQNVSVTGGAGGDTFTLEFNTIVTGAIPYNAPLATVDTELESLIAGTGDDFNVTGSPGNWDIEFTGDLAADDQPLLIGDDSGLVSGTLSITQTVGGSPAVDEMQQIALDPNTNGGTFRMTFSNGTISRTTVEVPFDATVAKMQNALEDLGSINGSANVEVDGLDGGPWEVTFKGALGGQNVDQINADVSNLTGPVSYDTFASESTKGAGGGTNTSNEKHTITPTPPPQSGDFTLSFDGETTTLIPFDATAAQVEQALEGLATINVGDIAVALSPGGWVVEFVGSKAGQDVPWDIIGNPANLAGGFLSPAVFAQSEIAADNEKQTITFDPVVTPDGGTFRLRFNGPEKTGPLSVDAAPSDVEAELELLPSVGSGNVRVTWNDPLNFPPSVASPGEWVVEFIDELAAADMPNIYVDTSALQRNELIQVDIETEAGPASEIQEVSLPAQTDGGTFTLGFQSIRVEELTPGSAVNNDDEEQSVRLPDGVTGGDFRLEFRGAATSLIPHNATASQVETALANLSTIAGTGNVSVSDLGLPAGQWNVTFTGTLEEADVPLIQGDASELTGGPFTTGTINHNATPNDVQTALQGLASLGAGSVEVTGPSIKVEEKVVGRDSIDEIQRIELPPGADGGYFTLSFKGQTTGDIPFGASDATVQSTLAASGPLLAGVTVTKPEDGVWEVEFTGTQAKTNVPLLNADTSKLMVPGGPWQIEFVGGFGGTPLEMLTGEGTSLLTTGFGSLTVETTAEGGDGNNVLMSTKRFNTFVSVEHLRIEGKEGDDRLIIEGAPSFSQGVFFDGGDGTDVLELVAGEQDPGFEASFVAPVFPGDDQGTLTFGSRQIGNGNQPGTAIQFASVEGEIIFSPGTIRGVEVNAGWSFGNEVQTITVPPGTEYFTITVDLNPNGPPRLATTYAIPFDASADYVRDALDSLSDNVINPATFTVDKLGPGEWEIEFGGWFSISEQPPLITNVGKVGHVSLSGTDDGDDMRFSAGPGHGNASFARGGQVRITLRNFADGSSVELLGQQGDDTISIALNGVTEFAQFDVRGGGPAGTDALRIEGTADGDDFTYTPGAFDHLSDTPSSKDGTVIVGGSTPVYLDVLGFEEYAFVGLGGTDSLTVVSPADNSNDVIRFFPEVGNDGSFQFTSQSGGPETAVVYSPVSLQSIETRTFDSKAGSDTLAFSIDRSPGVSTGLTVDGGSGTTTVAFDGQLTKFIHGPTQEDLLVLDMTVTRDEHEVIVSPGIGIGISLSVLTGYDALTFNAADANLTVNLDDRTISQPGYGDVTYIGTEEVGLVGGGTTHTLTFAGPESSERFVYTPSSPTAGSLVTDGSWATFGFEGFAGRFVINGGADVADEVLVKGTRGADWITVDGPGRTVSVINPVGTTLMPVELGVGVEMAGVDGLSGDDAVLVVPAPGNALPVEVYGSMPNASDRLIVKDEGLGDVVRHHQGADGRSGTVIVGLSSPVAYSDMERVDILPLNPVTGGTGNDGMGRIVVFHADRLEQNDSRLNPTELPDLAESTVKPNIDPGGVTDPFGVGLDLPGDEDWYRFVAPKIGTFRFQLLFDAIDILPNGQPGLPGDGLLRINVYSEDGTLIAKRPPEGDDSHTIGVEKGRSYFLRVRGVTPEVINLYDVSIIDLDIIGPQVTDVFITDDPGTAADESAFNLFQPKPADGPTPLVYSLTIRLQDLVERFPGFLYDALDQTVADQPGHYLLVGDHNGIIPISKVTVINDPPMVGEVATASIFFEFTRPLPDDRFTLSISDSLIDPTGMNLDGESHGVEPQGHPNFPTGDGIPGADFVARFTVDSVAEIGTWAAGSVWVDSNGNFAFDPENTDFVNRDIIYTQGFTSDNVFTGNFVEAQDGIADGFDKLAAYGRVGSTYRWLIDTNHDGDPDIDKANPTNPVNGLPVAGRFDDSDLNGDEVGLFAGNMWWFDTDHDFNVDTSLATSMIGWPIIGDFDGDGFDDLATWYNDTFQVDTANGVRRGWDGTPDHEFRFGFIGVREKPIAADFNGDGIDDIGLWVPDRDGVTPTEIAEWYILMSGDTSGFFDAAQDGIPGTVSVLDRIRPADDPIPGSSMQVEFNPIPFGRDIYARFGDEYGMPVVGNFDPPATGSTAQSIDTPAVVGRYLTYGNSAFSGDGALVPDKIPLVAGQTASFENYSSFDRGINGVVIEVAHAWNLLDASDFGFRMGNSDDTGQWGEAPTPKSIAVTLAEGTLDTTRVTIGWSDHAIKNQWLEITVRGDAIGLAHDDVFYFGSAVGETGNDASNALVNAADVIAILDNPRGQSNAASIDNPYDLNRDGLVDAVDLILARNNATSPVSALRMLTLAELTSPPAGEGEPMHATEPSVRSDTPSTELLDELMAKQANQPAVDWLLPTTTLSKLFHRFGSAVK